MLVQEIKNIPTTPRELKRFGLMMGAILFALAAYLFWKEKESYIYFVVVSAIFAGTGLLQPKLLRPVYQGWMTLAVIMGFVMTRVILTILFYGLFTPMALIAKLLGKDLLQQRWDKNARTYWVAREHGEFNPQSAERMF